MDAFVLSEALNRMKTQTHLAEIWSYNLNEELVNTYSIHSIGKPFDHQAYIPMLQHSINIHMQSIWNLFPYLNQTHVQNTVHLVSTLSRTWENTSTKK